MSQTIDQVWRDYRVDKVPASGDHEPVKAEIRALLKMIQNSGGQAVTRNTLSALNGVTPPTENYMGVVLNDPNPANNGYYSRVSGAWVRGRGFPDTFARVALSGSGTTQTGAVDTGVNPADIEVFFGIVGADNSGPLTLSVAGGPARAVVNVAGNPLAPGEWTGGVIFFLNDAGQYQLMLDAGAAESAAASATSAHEDAERAEEARDIATGAASAIVLADNIFATKATAEAWNPVGAPNFLRTAGYGTAGDGGGASAAPYVRTGTGSGELVVTQQDSTPIGFNIARLTGQILTPIHFGAKGDPSAVADDTLALQSAFDSGEDISLPRGRIFGVEGRIDLDQAAGQKLYGRGALRAMQAMTRLLYVKQSDIELDGIEVDGQDLVTEALVFVDGTTAGAVINFDATRLHLHNLHGGDTAPFQGSAGILMFRPEGVINISRNRIVDIKSNLYTPASAQGVARGVMIRVGNGFMMDGINIERNVVDEIRGSDGDGICIIGSSASVNNALISHNHIRNCDHRAIKTQGQKVHALFNTYSHPGAAAAFGAACIDLQVGRDCQATGNRVDATHFYLGIQVSGPNGIISNNTVKGGTGTVNGNTTYGLGILSGIGSRVHHNVVEDFQRAVVITASESCSVQSNHWQINTGSTRTIGITTSGVDLGGHIIDGNTAAGSISAIALVSWNGKESMVEGNFAHWASGNWSTVGMITGMGDNNLFRGNMQKSERRTVHKDTSLSSIPAGTQIDLNRNFGDEELSGEDLGLVGTKLSGAQIRGVAFNEPHVVYGTLSGGTHIFVGSGGWSRKVGPPANAGDGTVIT